MKRLDPRFISELSRQASACMRAIRFVQTLEDNLPPGFPEPNEIKTAKKPDDLTLEWLAANRKMAWSLRDKITKLLQLDGKWHYADPCWNPYNVMCECRERVRVGGKATINLCLRIIDAGALPVNRGSGSRG